ncbi:MULTISPECIES: helix-turn-helix domain-containing protein [Companilactobacillus]|uniref:Helix-turn-helix domain-containing protein n=1 Tax=Companilactobacillus futsaii TaxID=938155 RepID=A0A5B7T5F5_9LACO|nr:MULTISPECIES: helix-turn-helix domain-containing protein [Companilactobacillus]QCX25759.1 helix-turn-helix domain-containing protein [Companilactobacillus futsaii]
MENVRYMNYKQTKEYLNVKSYATIHKLIDQGLRVSVINGVKRFDRLDVDEFMNSKKIGDKN